MTFTPLSLSSFVVACCLALQLSTAQAQLQHRYSFDTDASDSVGTADWTLEGTANVTGGQLVLDGTGTKAGGDLSRAVQDGSTIAINTYPAITMEFWATPNSTFNTGFHTAAGFGFDDPADGTGNDVPNDYIILQTHRGTDTSRVAISVGDDGSPWDEEDGVDGTEFNDNAQHHYVGVITNQDISLYVDGALAAVGPVGSANGGNAANNMISGLSNQEAWLGFAYGIDPLWAGSISEYRIYNDAASLNYAERSFAAGPDTVVTFEEEFDLTAYARTDTGEVRIYNTNPSENVSFNYYLLSDSDSGDAEALDVANWNSLDNQNVDAAAASDFDGSGGAPDGADLTQWQGDYGVNGDSDANGDGESDGADFLTWQQQLGQLPGPGDSWDEAGGSSDSQVAEALLNGQTTLAPGEFVTLGNVYDDSVDTEFEFKYGVPGGIILRGGGLEYVTSFPAALANASAVPEPTTLSALLGALACLLWTRPQRVSTIARD